MRLDRTTPAAIRKLDSHGTLPIALADNNGPGGHLQLQVMYRHSVPYKVCISPLSAMLSTPFPGIPFKRD